MKKYDDLKVQLNDAVAGAKTDIAHLNTIADEAGRISKTARDAHIIISDLDRQFEEKTKLTKVDITLLFFAVALQVARQYFVTNFKEREGHNEAAKDAKEIEKRILYGAGDKEGIEEKIKGAHAMAHNWYHPSIEEVTFNPVPFDVTRGIEGLGGGFEHRAKTLGHDPILGYIFGTANIATSTLTAWTLQSFHVKYLSGFPTITHNAFTPKIFTHIYDRVKNESDGAAVLAVSVFREAMHLKSDVNSKVSLPVPIVSKFSPDFAKTLAKYGLDVSNIQTIAKQAALAALINTIIGMIHYLFYDETRDGTRTLYEVRTRKILTYSNVIASASNLIAVGIMSAVGIKTGGTDLVKKALSYLDIGGLMVTLYRIVTDYQFIKKIKQEFLEKEFYNRVYGDEYDF